MFADITSCKTLSIPLIEQSSIVTMLAVSAIFFLVLLVLGIMKSAKLKAENERLSKTQTLTTGERNKIYQDFREGHLYDNF